jgi:hypothetical protein
VAALTDLGLHLHLVGVVLVALGAVHAVLPRALDWGGELAGVSLLHRQVSYVHCFFVGLTCLLWGLLPLSAGDALVEPHPVTRVLLTGAVVFWGARLVVQLGLFNPAHARTSRRWLAASVAGTALWAYLTGVWGWALAGQFPVM